MSTINDKTFSVRREKGKIKDKKVSILEAVNVRDNESGQIVQKWRYIHKDIWAYVRQFNANEKVASGANHYIIEYLFAINYREGLKNTNRILYNGSMYRITAVDYFEGYKQDIIIIAEKAEN